MIAKKARKQKNRYRGVAAVEAAVVFPLLIILTFGVIEYGWMFLKIHQITNAARHGSRVAIRPTATNAHVTASIDALMVSADITGYQVTISPADVTLLNVGETIEVGITVPWANIAIMNISLLPKPANIQASTTMAKEGF